VAGIGIVLRPAWARVFSSAIITWISRLLAVWRDALVPRV
jgi:hypothetical protein